MDLRFKAAHESISEFLSFGAQIVIWGQITLCRGVDDCSVHCSIPGLHPLDARGTPVPAL